MSMRQARLALFILILFPWHAFPQDAYIAQQLAALKSSDWQARDVACQRLTAIPRWGADPVIRRALVDTLAHENAVIDASFLKGKGVESEYGEGYSEYVASLQDDVTHFAFEQGEQHAMDVLVHSPYNPDSKFAERLGEVGDAVVPSVLDMWRNGDEAERAEGLGVMGQLLRSDRRGPPVSLPNRAILKNALLRGVLDKDVGVRWNAVRSLGFAAGPQDLPLLERIAASDPDVAKVAEKALDRARKRLSAPNHKD